MQKPWYFLVFLLCSLSAAGLSLDIDRPKFNVECNPEILTACLNKDCSLNVTDGQLSLIIDTKQSLTGFFARGEPSILTLRPGNYQISEHQFIEDVKNHAASLENWCKTPIKQLFLETVNPEKSNDFPYSSKYILASDAVIAQINAENNVIDSCYFREYNHIESWITTTYEIKSYCSRQSYFSTSKQYFPFLWQLISHPMQMRAHHVLWFLPLLSALLLIVCSRVFWLWCKKTKFFSGNLFILSFLCLQVLVFIIALFFRSSYFSIVKISTLLSILGFIFSPVYSIIISFGFYDILIYPLVSVQIILLQLLYPYAIAWALRSHLRWPRSTYPLWATIVLQLFNLLITLIGYGVIIFLLQPQILY